MNEQKASCWWLLTVKEEDSLLLVSEEGESSQVRGNRGELEVRSSSSALAGSQLWSGKYQYYSLFQILVTILSRQPWPWPQFIHQNHWRHDCTLNILCSNNFDDMTDWSSLSCYRRIHEHHESVRGCEKRLRHDEACGQKLRRPGSEPCRWIYWGQASPCHLHSDSPCHLHSES